MSSIDLKGSTNNDQPYTCTQHPKTTALHNFSATLLNLAMTVVVV
jgi:hypothetical protein